MILTVIAAVAENGIIGRDDDLPWHLPRDLRRFKRLTVGHPILMGRKTWESIGRPLPGRTSIVLTRQAALALPEGVLRAASLDEALALVPEADEVFVIGGEAVYAEALARADRLQLTRVHAEPAGDARFPDPDLVGWSRVAEERHEADDRHEHAFTFETWERGGPASGRPEDGTASAGRAPLSAAGGSGIISGSPSGAGGSAPAEGDSMDREVITVVSGLPRSGTSMMMRMLEAGGLEVMTDGVREADVDNPRGYYEYERVKQIKEDKSWIPGTRGKVFKMVSLLLYDLPTEERYRVVLMRRDTEEILASERKMLMRLGKDPDHVSDARMAEIFRKHLAHLEGWIGKQTHLEVLQVSYNDVLTDPDTVLAEVARFCGGLDAASMAAVVDKSLYRNRGGSTAA